ncbi:MAG TPA: TM2 domain-containing protein [Candidatus Bathyarchaeia archaeon]|nr:TM2 domain-containing protein [Candidatus Bathyarchaeia archaeon]
MAGTPLLYNRKLASQKSRSFALILCLFGGIFGLHRFYLRKFVTAILYLFTAGFFTIGIIVDLVLITAGRFKDANGYQLTAWDGYKPINPNDLNILYCPRCNSSIFAYKQVHSLDTIKEQNNRIRDSDDAKRIHSLLEKKEVLLNPEGDAYIVFCVHCGQIV